jgi:hypothetical protein
MSDEAASFLRLISEKQFPSRLGGWRAALSALTQRAEASPYAMEGLLSPQLQEMAQKILASNAKLSRTFGPYGGTQLPYAMGQARAGLDLPGAYANTAIESGQKRQDFLGGTSIMAPQGQTFTETKQRPVDLAQIAQQIAGVVQAGASLYGGARGATQPGPTSGSLPTTWDAYSQGGSAQTAYAPFGTAPSGGGFGGGGGGMTFGNAGAYPYLYQ